MFGSCLGDHLSAVALTSVTRPVFHHLICRGRDATEEVGRSILPRDGRAGSVATSPHPNPEHPPFAPADKPSISVIGRGARFPKACQRESLARCPVHSEQPLGAPSELAEGIAPG